MGMRVTERVCMYACACARACVYVCMCVCVSKCMRVGVQSKQAVRGQGGPSPKLTRAAGSKAVAGYGSSSCGKS